MPISESGEIIGRLLGSGLSGESIGRALGRDRSLVSQIARGVKPGTNLRDSLAQLEARVAGLSGHGADQAARAAAVPEPPRRQTRAGRPANVRRPTTVRGRTYATSTTKRQAVRHGARGMGHPLADAADQGRTVAVTVSVDRGLSIANSSGGKRKRAQLGSGGTVELELGDAGAVWDEVQSEYGGNFAEYVADQALERGYVSGAEDGREVVQHMQSMELRSY